MKASWPQAMKDGALGLSTSLQYVPARFAKTNEIVELAKVARQYGGIYATHQRSEANALDESLAEVFQIAREARIPVEIWHLKTAYKKNWGRMPEVLAKIRKAARRRVSISPPTSIRTSPAARRLARVCRHGCWKAALNKMLSALARHAHSATTEKRDTQRTPKIGKTSISAAAAQPGVLISSVSQIASWNRCRANASRRSPLSKTRNRSKRFSI